MSSCRQCLNLRVTLSLREDVRVRDGHHIGVALEVLGLDLQVGHHLALALVFQIPAVEAAQDLQDAGLRVVQQWIVGGTTSGCTDDGQVTSCPVTKNEVPSLIAWADDATATLAAPTGFTQVCTTSNDCTEISGPIDLSETPVRLLP